ncbi:cupin domain-containing protein [Streptomyces sp. NPDC050704]|uniref:cupin domain-containing protein n=1 Tax=Streptomyces sp. NPDC050704 TaxID=3157219 RepID=UPI00342DF83C
MSISNLAQREDQQQLEWIGGSVFSALLDAEAPPLHVHNNEDVVFLLLSGSALVWAGEEEYELREGGILPRRIPHGYRITSKKADLLFISTPGGLEKMFRHAGRDLREPRPEGFEISAQLLAEAAELSGNVVLGPPR